MHIVCVNIRATKSSKSHQKWSVMTLKIAQRHQSDCGTWSKSSRCWWWARTEIGHGPSFDPYVSVMTVITLAWSRGRKISAFRPMQPQLKSLVSARLFFRNRRSGRECKIHARKIASIQQSYVGKWCLSSNFGAPSTGIFYVGRSCYRVSPDVSSENDPSRGQTERNCFHTCKTDFFEVS